MFKFMYSIFQLSAHHAVITFTEKVLEVLIARNGKNKAELEINF